MHDVNIVAEFEEKGPFLQQGIPDHGVLLHQRQAGYVVSGNLVEYHLKGAGAVITRGVRMEDKNILFINIQGYHVRACQGFVARHGYEDVAGQKGNSRSGFPTDCYCTADEMDTVYLGRAVCSKGVQIEVMIEGAIGGSRFQL